MNTTSPSGDLVVLKRADSSIVLRVTGYEARVLVIIPRRVKEHDAVLRRVVEILECRQKPAAPDLPPPRLPVPERV